MAGCDENCVLRQLRQLLDTMLTPPKPDSLTGARQRQRYRNPRTSVDHPNRGEHYEVGRFSAWRSIYVVFCYDLRGGGVSLPIRPLSVITPSAGTLRLRMMGVAKAPIRRATMSPSRRSSPSRRRSSPPRPKPAKRDSTAKPLLPSSPPPPPKAVAQMPQADQNPAHS